MKGEDSTIREELRDFETGWIPWVLAATYFPVYILLDFTLGDVLADRIGLPQSVSVGLVSLTISSAVVLVFVLVNLRHAAPRPRHGLGSPRGRLGRRWTRLFAPLTGAVLTVFVVARNGVAMLLAGLWSVVARVGGLGYRVVVLLARPFVLVAALLARPIRAAVSLIGGVVRRDSESPADELDGPVDRRPLEEGFTSSPLQRTDATSDDSPTDGGSADPGGPSAAEAETNGRGHGIGDRGDEPDVATDEVSQGDVDETSDTSADDEDAVDDPGEADWPDDWISASDV